MDDVCFGDFAPPFVVSRHVDDAAVDPDNKSDPLFCCFFYFSIEKTTKQLSSSCSQ
jgi:hypothetical protein